jgi:hypothetical protein
MGKGRRLLKPLFQLRPETAAVLIGAFRKPGGLADQMGQAQ